MAKIYDTCFLVMSEYGIQRMTKRQAGLKRGEVAVKVKLSMPEECFAEPQVSAVIDVPMSAIRHPEVVVEVEEPEPREQADAAA